MHALWQVSCMRFCSWLNMHVTCRVAGAEDAGPVAVIRDERQIVRVTGGTVQPVVQIFSCAGTPLGAFVWDGGNLAAFAWTASQQLLTLESTGQVQLPSLFTAGQVSGEL